MVVVWGVTVAGYHKVQPLPLQTLPFAQPDDYRCGDIRITCTFALHQTQTFRHLRQHADDGQLPRFPVRRVEDIVQHLGVALQALTLRYNLKQALDRCVLSWRGLASERKTSAFRIMNLRPTLEQLR